MCAMGSPLPPTPKAQVVKAAKVTNTDPEGYGTGKGKKDCSQYKADPAVGAFGNLSLEGSDLSSHGLEVYFVTLLELLLEVTEFGAVGMGLVSVGAKHR